MTTLILNNQFKQFDLNGEPLAAGLVYTYEVGTTTPKVTYQDQDKVAAHTNPIVLDSFGEATIWIDGDTKLVIQDSDGVDIRTYPSFSDAETTGETPVVSSPGGAVLRSLNTEVGYIKIRLPMGEWPNTKMMFDVMVYTDDADDAFTLTLGGYADSNTSAWLTTTAITNGISDYDIQFGNDGTYPAIYIGAVDTNWVKPQISVVNFLAGQFSYDWTTWDNGWEITVTTSLGTITSTKEVIGIRPRWGEWQTPSLSSGWTNTGGSLPPIRYRMSTDGKDVNIVGVVTKAGGTLNPIFTMPLAYRPATYSGVIIISALAEESRRLLIGTAGGIAPDPFASSEAGNFYINGTYPLD